MAGVRSELLLVLLKWRMFQSGRRRRSGVSLGFVLLRWSWSRARTQPRRSPLRQIRTPLGCLRSTEEAVGNGVQLVLCELARFGRLEGGLWSRSRRDAVAVHYRGLQLGLAPAGATPGGGRGRIGGRLHTCTGFSLWLETLPLMGSEPEPKLRQSRELRRLQCASHGLPCSGRSVASHVASATVAVEG